MARSSRATVETNKMRLLAYLAIRAEQEPGLGTSFKVMVNDLGLTEGRLRSCCRALKADGLLQVEARFDADGGQKANVYVPTPIAHRVLAELQEKGWSCRG